VLFLLSQNVVYVCVRMCVCVCGGGGCISNRHLTAKSGLLKHLKYGDLVLADRGFDISDDLAIVGASLAILPFTKGKLNYPSEKLNFPNSSLAFEFMQKEP